ncbi:MAG TPA: Calx-beta domain-containing protein [Pyrinomonadaceae bacterium]|nr:Calx-beta domain-containing protein [Pyrinomonadaceae bacterium]
MQLVFRPLFRSKSPVFAAVVLTFVFCVTVSAQFNPLPGSFFEHDFFPQHKVFDISPNNQIAITVRSDSAAPGSDRLTTFDPILGTVFDNETFVSAGAREVRFAQVGSSLRAVVLAGSAARTIFLFDISATGQITPITSTQLSTSNGVGGSNIVLSGAGAAGFAVVIGGAERELVSFSLNDGSVLKRTPVTGLAETITLYEGGGKRLLAFRSGLNLRVLNVLDAANPVDSASVPMTTNGEFSGFFIDDIAFSGDGRYVFFTSQFFQFQAIDLNVGQVVGTIPGLFRFVHAEVFEDAQHRQLAVLSLPSGTTNVSALLLVDATNPSQLTVQKNYTQQTPLGMFFKFSQDGSRLYMTEPGKLVAHNLPDFTTAWEQSVPGFNTRDHQLEVYGPNGEILGVWQSFLTNDVFAVFGAFPASPPNVSLSNSVSVNESVGAKADFTVTLSAPTNHRTDINYSTTNGTAEAGSDYTTTSGTLTLAPGVTSGIISIPVSDDNLDEADETFTLNITSSPGIVTHGPRTVTIVDDDPPPSATIADLSTTEGTSTFSNKLVSFTVTLSAASGQTVTVAYATAPDTASNTDFVPVSGTLSFAPGQTTNNVIVQYVGDRLAEDDESFFINLSNPSNVTIADAQAVATIVDDDAPILQTASARATALDAVTFLPEPFALTNPLYFGNDKRGRVMVFTLNLVLTPGLVVTAQGVDDQQVTHQLPVELVANVPSFIPVFPQEPALTQIVLKLPESITTAGDLRVRITARGKVSNQAVFAVKP